jgi:hypothetical protein
MTNPSMNEYPVEFVMGEELDFQREPGYSMVSIAEGIPMT